MLLTTRARPAQLPGRIVSLVPSLTEALFALGFGARVVGISEYCVHPAEALRDLPRVGGTKTPALDAIVALAPDLVLANQEENRRRDIEALEARGLRVWLTYPRTVAAALCLLEELAAWGATKERIEAVIQPARRAFDSARSATHSANPFDRPERLTEPLTGALARPVPPLERAEPLAERPPLPVVFCPIWKNPWMTIGGDTYAHDLLALCGAQNPFAGAGERRYPLVSEPQIVAAAPEVVLLPDEPYAFGPRDVAELAKLPLPAARAGRIHLLDGTLISWYGPRISNAIETLRALLRDPEGGD